MEAICSSQSIYVMIYPRRQNFSAKDYVDKKKSGNCSRNIQLGKGAKVKSISYAELATTP
jgi:hypothetical protein